MARTGRPGFLLSPLSGWGVCPCVTPTPHDSLFRAVFASPVHAVGPLRAALPPVLARAIDWSTLDLVSGSFVDDQLRQQHADLLFRCSVRAVA